MIRSLASILAALHIAAPGLPYRADAAVTLQELGKRHRIDPLTLVAVVENESRWHSSVTSTDQAGREYIGLAQLRLVNFRECAELASSECAERRQALLEWRTNLTIAASYFGQARAYCKRTVGTDDARYWMQVFQGWDAQRHATCGHVRRGKRWVALPVPVLTRQVLQRRRELAAGTARPIGVRR